MHAVFSAVAVSQYYFLYSFTKTSIFGVFVFIVIDGFFNIISISAVVKKSWNLIIGRSTFKLQKMRVSIVMKLTFF